MNAVKSIAVMRTQQKEATSIASRKSYDEVCESLQKMLCQSVPKFSFKHRNSIIPISPHITMFLNAQ